MQEDVIVDDCLSRQQQQQSFYYVLEIMRRSSHEATYGNRFPHVADFLADLITSMAIADVSAQMRRGIVERELGYYRGALRRKVSVCHGTSL